MDNTISVEVKWKEDGARFKALTASLAQAHFSAMGERGEGEKHFADEDYGLVDGTENSRTVDRLGGHGSRVAEECEV